MPSFFSSIADKAQSALANIPLSGSTGDQPSANEAAATGGAHAKNHTLEALQYQLRSLGQQYSSSTTPVQRIITVEKGVAIDLDSLSRDCKAQSKELYTWGQNEEADMKDVTDRLAYLNFVQGSLASSLATKLNAARAPMKALRDAETAITPRRNILAGLKIQLARLEHDNQKGMERRIRDLKTQIASAEEADLPQEREIQLLKRKAVRESEQLKWDAIQEYGEKLAFLSLASKPITEALPILPPTPDKPYTGTHATGAARASLQRALDNYKPGNIHLPSEGADLGRSDTRSFGESHAHELSSIASTDISHNEPGIPVTPPSKASSPIIPSNLNLTPAPIPSHPSVEGSPSTTAPAPATVAPDTENSAIKIPGATPTIAETGVPVAASEQGPGPASGSLHDVKAASPIAGPRSGGLPHNESQEVYGSTAPKWESAAEEKRRMAAQYSPAAGGTSQTPVEPVKHETAEEEKKRLEKEGRERVLREGGSAPKDDSKDGKGNDDDLPPYQEI